ncbi:MAG: DUF58 domain-containing protein [bacterium]|nr:DUF58 domain-containing protein [bacterium]
MSAPFDPSRFAALATLALKARYVMEGFLHGIHGSPFHGPSVEFADYRDYQPGDDLRHLDWRLYARNDRLCIKRFEQETNARCYLALDTSASMTYRGARAWGSKLDCARVMATALAWFLLKQNDAVGLVALSPGAGRVADGDSAGRLCYLPPSQQSSRLGRMMAELEALDSAGDAALVELLQHTGRLAHRRSLILLFTDLLEPSEEVELAFKRFRFDGHECLVFQVLDPDEIDFPFDDPGVFEDLESGERRQVAGADARDAYLSRFAAFMRRHEELFRLLEMPHAVIRTDQDPGKALGRFLSSRARR